MRVAVVANPIRVSAARLGAAVEAACRSRGWPAPTVRTTTVEDPGAGQAAAAVREGSDIVVVCGGDGTVREAASALAGTGVHRGEADEPALGPLDRGVRSLGVDLHDLLARTVARVRERDLHRLAVALHGAPRPRRVAQAVAERERGLGIRPQPGAVPDVEALAILQPAVRRHDLAHRHVRERRRPGGGEASARLGRTGEHVGDGVERLFLDLMARCAPRQLSVQARYTRRGGLDINPWRGSPGMPAPAPGRSDRQ